MSYHLEGQRVGRLTVVEHAGSKRNHRMWFCVCDCGLNNKGGANPMTVTELTDSDRLDWLEEDWEHLIVVRQKIASDDMAGISLRDLIDYRVSQE